MASGICSSHVTIDSFSYLSPRNAVIHKCHDTRVVLGPVAGRLRLSECRNTVVVCAARSVVVADCRGVVVHTLTPQRPLLVGSRTQGVTLAPLNIHYPKLKHHMAKAQLQSHINMWNRPLHLGECLTLFLFLKFHENQCSIYYL